MVKLGDRVRDRISGLKGIVTGRHEYLYGCIRFSVTPETAKDGKPGETAVFDEAQLVLLKPRVLEPYQAASQAPAGPRPDPVRPTPPVR